MCRHHSAVMKAHRALPVCEWPALVGMPWAIARSNASSAVCRRCARACPQLQHWMGRWFVGGAVLLNAGVFQMLRRRSATTAHRALPLSEWPVLGMPWATARSHVASAVCSWRCGGAFTGCAVARLGRWFVGNAVCWMLEFSRCEGTPRQPQRTEPCQCVSDQPRAWHGSSKGQIQPVQCAVGVLGPAPVAAAGLGRWFVEGAILLNAGVFKV